MTAKLSFFPVANGDMTLVRTEKGNTILIDMNIRAEADNEDDDTPDVAAMLREKLSKDADGRLCVDALLVSHPDQDHCRGLRNHFHLGPPEDRKDEEELIFIREIWSSPMVFRRASKKHTLTKDAKAFNKEAKRRVRKYEDSDGVVEDGDRILILGEDEAGKTEGLESILVKVDETFSAVNGEKDSSMTVRLLAPLPADDDDDVTKNDSSTVLRFSLSGGGVADKCRFLTGGDAGVSVWERLWSHHSKRKSWLSFDLLLAPHHCSWHSLSRDSWSEKGDKGEVSADARDALSQARSGATIVASSKPIKDDDNDPPCIGAKREYVEIIEDVDGSFKCVGEEPTEEAPDVLEFEVGRHGLRLGTALMGSATVRRRGGIGGQALPHGSVER